MEEKDSKEFLEQELLDKNVVEIGKIIEDYEVSQIVELFHQLGYEQSAEIFAYLPLSVKQEVILNLDQKDIQELLEYLYSDDIIEFIEESDDEVKQKVLDSASKKRRLQLTMQMNFKENSAGSMMSVDFIELDIDDTSEQALQKIKDQESIAETVSYCYVTSEQHTLVGVITLKEVLLAPEHSFIKDIMENDVISVDVDEDQEIVAQTMSKYDMLALPVVNPQHKILGIITIDDVLDIIEDETTEDIHKMSGVTNLEGSYLDTSFVKIAKSRIFWLLILMISATISGFIIGKNEDITVKLPSLLIFMPMLMDTAGNAGSQSSAMVIRGIVVDDLSMKNFATIFKKEWMNSMILGSCLFLVNTLRIILFMPDISWHIALLVSATIFIIVLIANLAGGLLPLIGNHFKLDPASMSGPVLTTVCDAISLLTYFSLASLYLGGTF